MNKDTKNFKLEIKSFDEQTGEISFYGAVFNNIDSYDDVILPGAFKNCLTRKKPKEIKFCYNHDRSVFIGTFDKLEEDNYGLFVKGRLILDLEKGKEAYILTKNNILDGFSIGYRALDSEEIGGIRYLKEIDLFEISLVIDPANPSAKLVSVKSQLLVDEKDAIINEEEVKGLFSEGSIPNQYMINNKLVFSKNKDGQMALNFKAIEGLTLEEKESNLELIRIFYQAFRKSFDDYTIMSPVCEKKSLIASWDLREFDRYLKKELSNAEIKAFYNRIDELKNKKNKEEFDDANVQKHLKNRATLEECILLGL